MKYIKNFENNNESDYVGKFCFFNSEDENINMYIALCNRIDFKENFMVYVEFECFDVDKNGNIVDPAGDSLSITIEELNKINFMTPVEFYNKHKDTCEKLYNKIREDFKKEYMEYWKARFVINYKNKLETIPEFKFFVDSDKFNI